MGMLDIIQSPVVVVNSSTRFTSPYAWEASFDFVGTRKWVTETRNSIICLALFYVVVMFSIQKFMEKRPAYKLRHALVIWNSVLAVLSAVGFYRILPHFINQLENGFRHSVCKLAPINISSAYWIYVLTLLKIVELGDTLFIVLRKQKLIFLHWYHHFSILIFAWIAYELHEPGMLWLVVLNSFVHSVMYSYYALKAAGFKIPQQYSMLITTIQIMQFVMAGIVICYAAATTIGAGSYKCEASSAGVLLGFVGVIPYLALFMKFFYDTYLSPGKKIPRKGKGTTESITTHRNGKKHAA